MFQQVKGYVQRWLWLLVLGTLLPAVASYLVSQGLPRTYEASARLLVMPGQNPAGGAAAYDDVLAAERLTRTYSELLKSRPVVEAALQQVGLGQLQYDRALRQIRAEPVRDTQLLQVSAQAGDPQRAADLANALASTFVQQMQASQSGRDLLAIVEPAAPESEPVAPRIAVNVALAAGAGLLLALGLAGIREPHLAAEVRKRMVPQPVRNRRVFTSGLELFVVHPIL